MVHQSSGWRVEHQAGLAAGVADQPERAVDVLGGLGWKVMTLAPALAKSGTMRSTGFTIRCTSIGAVGVRADGLAHQRADGELGT